METFLICSSYDDEQEMYDVLYPKVSDGNLYINMDVIRDLFWFQHSLYKKCIWSFYDLDNKIHVDGQNDPETVIATYLTIYNMHIRLESCSYYDVENGITELGIEMLDISMDIYKKLDKHEQFEYLRDCTFESTECSMVFDCSLIEYGYNIKEAYDAVINLYKWKDYLQNKPNLGKHDVKQANEEFARIIELH